MPFSTVSVPTAVTPTALLTSAALVLTWLWWRSTRRPAGVPPGPGPALPVLGHLHLLDKDPRAQFRAWRRQFGNVFSLYMGNRLMVVLNGREVIKEALVKQADTFSERPNVLILELMTKSKGVADTSGLVWKAQRKTSLEILRQFGMGKHLLAEKVQDEVGEYIKAIHAKESQSFDPTHMTQVSVSNNICSILFGQRFDYDDENFQKLIETMDEIVKLSGGTSVVLFLPFLRHMPGDPFKIRRIVDLYRFLADTFLIPAIDKHIRNSTDDQQNDFISAYLQDSKEASKKGTAEYVNELNLQKILFDLYAAGTDTTAATIRWAVIYLVHHPEVQERCYQDVVKVTGSSRAPEFRDRSEMTYVEATIMEVLRIAEIAPFAIFHSTTCDAQLSGYIIPKESFVMVNLDSVLHDPDVWEEPNKFRPERFLDAEGKLTRPDQFIPFSTGRRVCLGESLARMELFLYLSTMIQHFRFLPPENGQLPSLQGFLGLIHHTKPFLVRAVPRN